MLMTRLFHQVLEISDLDMHSVLLPNMRMLRRLFLDYLFTLSRDSPTVQIWQEESLKARELLFHDRIFCTFDYFYKIVFFKCFSDCRIVIDTSKNSYYVTCCTEIDGMVLTVETCGTDWTENDGTCWKDCTVDGIC